jgi:hypothetical protein
MSNAMQLHEAVLAAFCDPVPKEYSRLLHLPHKQWNELLRWLDISGLALYFLDRLEELNLLETLPASVLARLKQNRADNAQRIGAMIAESATIQSRFQEAGLSYAVVKGFSLWPHSFARLESRSQLDLDFLVAQGSASRARQILEEVGYKLHIATDRHWDFKADEDKTGTLRDLYKPGMRRSAELHMEATSAERTAALSRACEQLFHGISMPVLAPVDLFVGQGLHLYKHVCSQFYRAAHLIEFRRHVIARYHDLAFWAELRSQVLADPSACIRLGLVTHLIAHVMGPFAPEAFTCWTVDPLPAAAKLWVKMYGHRSVLAEFPGSKLYLLLENELQHQGLAARRTLWQALVPRRLPRQVSKAADKETLPVRIQRHRRHCLYVLFRLRFSVVEGVRFLRESILWRQCRNGLPQ